MITCVLCGKPMVAVAPGVLMHLDELRAALRPEIVRSTFEPLVPAA